jgi:hypothetical protein
MALSDLSMITDELVALVQSAINAAGLEFPATVSGAMPESVRSESGCQVTLYLFRIAADGTTRNTPVIGPQLARQRPFGLVLYYLLTVAANSAYIQEQRAMSIALRTLHDTPFLRIPGVTEEMSVTLENESFDRLGVLWQAASTSFRLSAVYRVAVAFLQAPEPPAPAAPPPTAFALSVQPTSLPFGAAGQLVGAFSRLTFLTLEGSQEQSLTPAVVAPGGEFLLFGAGLNRPGPPPTNQVFLTNADGSGEQNVSDWRAAQPTLHTESRLTLRLPASVGTPPADAPPPGIYLVSVGGGSFRTNSVPLSVAAAITGVAAPPILPAVAGLYTVDGLGFIASGTQVFLDTVALTEVAGAPAAGEFQLQNAGTRLVFRPPASLGAGRYPLRVRVHNVESAPSWWVQV